MTSMNETVVTSTRPARIIRVTTDLIAAYIIGAVFALAVLIFLLVLAREVYIKLRSYRKGPITLTPVIPFPQDNLQVFKGTDRYKNVPDARIQADDWKNKLSSFIWNYWRETYDLYGKINRYMSSTYKLDRLPDEYEQVESGSWERRFVRKSKISVLTNVRTILLKMNGFQHGERCHDFEPIGGAAPGSHYTYQMYGANRIQVTRYVMDGKSEIAGFCIYIEHPWLSPDEFRWSLLYELARSVKITEASQISERRRNERNQQKNGMEPEENTNLISQELDDRDWTGKYCLKLQRIVLSNMDSGGVVVHQEWIHLNNRMRIEKCEECTKEGLEKEEQPPTYSSMFVV